METAGGSMQATEPAQPAAESVQAPTGRRSPLALLWKVVVWALAAVFTIAVVGLLAINVGPRFLPYQALVVRSGSMSPTIPTGSVVFYRKAAASQIKVGDVIVFDAPGHNGLRVTHRVHAIRTGANGRYYITKGDANAAPDDWHVPAVGTGWVATAHVPEVGYLLYALQSTVARLLLLVIPALVLG
ncbi:MAG: signal peptidase I [Solirubrobacteraceae bacterium]